MLGISRPGDPLTACEFDLWRDYYQRHGFDVDVLKWTVARAGAATAGAMGAKVSPRDLVPRFGRSKADAETVKSWFDSLTPERLARGTHP